MYLHIFNTPLGGGRRLSFGRRNITEDMKSFRLADVYQLCKIVSYGFSYCMCCMCVLLSLYLLQQLLCVVLLCHPLTSETLATLAGEAIELVDARASILAGTWQTVVPVQVTVLPHPSGLAVTAVTGNTGEQSIRKPEYKLKPVGLAISLQGG